MAYTQEQVSTVTQRLEAARRAGTLAQLVGHEEAAKWGNKPISGGAQDLINAFGLSDLEAVYNQGGGAPPPPGIMKSPPPHPGVAPPPAKAAPKPTPTAPRPLATAPRPTPTGGGGGAGGAAPAAFAGLKSSIPDIGGGGGMGGGGGEGATGAQMLNAPNALRQGIGTRIPPMMSMALAGLQRVY